MGTATGHIRESIALRVCAFALMILAWPTHTEALTPDEQASLVEAFAPVFVFHPAERFFPMSPLEPVPACDMPPCEGTRAGAALEQRTLRYDAQPTGWKLERAAVFYRVNEHDRSLRQGQIRIEYWLYYVANRYALHGGLIPFTADGNHPHDLEYVFLIVEPLTPDARAPRDFALREVWASAHAGSIATNHFRWSTPVAADRRLDVLVELGSHAMAPDVDGNDSYSTRADASGQRTFMWGIRDRGNSWARYRPSYEDTRSQRESVRLSPDWSGVDPATATERYRLEPVTSLDVTVAPLAPLLDETREAYREKHLLSRLFGDVDIRTLLSPEFHPDGRNPDRVTNAAARIERGLAVGFTPVLSPATTFVSGRYSHGLGGGYMPTATLNATALLLPGRTLGELDASVWYPVDVLTKVLVGGQVRTDLFSWEPNRYSLHAGVEFRLGRWRWRVLARNARYQAKVEFKMYYFVWQ